MGIMIHVPLVALDSLTLIVLWLLCPRGLSGRTPAGSSRVLTKEGSSKLWEGWEVDCIAWFRTSSSWPLQGPLLAAYPTCPSDLGLAETDPCFLLSLAVSLHPSTNCLVCSQIFLFISSESAICLLPKPWLTKWQFMCVFQEFLRLLSHSWENRNKNHEFSSTYIHYETKCLWRSRKFLDYTHNSYFKNSCMFGYLEEKPFLGAKKSSKDDNSLL